MVYGGPFMAGVGGRSGAVRGSGFNRFSVMASSAVKKVVVMMAMVDEARPLLAELGYDAENPTRTLHQGSGLGMVFEGKAKGGMEVGVVCNGKCRVFGCDNVGKVPAALVTHMAISDLKPDLLINAGTCGGFKSMGANIGDVFVVSSFKSHDARIPLPNFEKFGVGNWGAYPASHLREALGLKTGILCTGDSLDCPDHDRAKLIELEATVKDMEGSAIAYTAQLHDVPVLGIKAVTDIVDGDRATQDEFLENLHTAAASLNKTLNATLAFIDGKSLVEV